MEFPSDYVHLLMSKFANYDDYDMNALDDSLSARIFQDKDLEQLKEHLNEWKIKKIFEPDFSEKLLKMCRFKAILFSLGEKNLVLAFSGFENKFVDLVQRRAEILNEGNGVLINGLIPQLFKCFQITEEACELANKSDSTLSFTGYANGAWLAEYAIHFGHVFDFKIKKSKLKSVLFESPGICRSSEEVCFKSIHKQYNYNKENNLDLVQDVKSMDTNDNEYLILHENIVNYLYKPNFANSFNKHHDKTYRIMDENLNKNTKLSNREGKEKGSSETNMETIVPVQNKEQEIKITNEERLEKTSDKSSEDGHDKLSNRENQEKEDNNANGEGQEKNIKNEEKNEKKELTNGENEEKKKESFSKCEENLNNFLNALRKLLFSSIENDQTIKVTGTLNDACQTIFNHYSINKIIDLFDPATGKPKRYVRVIDWPVMKISIGNSFKNDLMQLLSIPLNELVNYIPIKNQSTMATTF
jgi:hypothetical protein